MVANDFFIDAFVVEIAGSPYVSDPVDNSSFSLVAEADEPLSFSGDIDNSAGGQSAWWLYVPGSDGSVTADTLLGTEDTVLAVYESTGPAITDLSLIGWDDDGGGLPPGSSTYTWSATAGTRYYIQVLPFLPHDNFDYILRVDGPDTTVVYAPPVVLRIFEPIITAGPVETTVDVAAEATLPVVIISPPIGLSVSLRVPTSLHLELGLLEPRPGFTVPVLRPSFAVGVTFIDGDLDDLSIDIQYDTDIAFGSPVTLSKTIEPMLNYSITRIQAEADLTDEATYYWRARLRYNGVTGAYSSSAIFTVDTSYGNRQVAVRSNVVAGTPEPHLWMVIPDSAAPGETALLVGQGFSDAEGTVTIGGTGATISSWDHIVDSGATTADMVISRDGAIDPEHDEVVIVVPDVPPPGGAILVEGP